MCTYLILKLEGVMQAWGGHTFEDSRPSELFPTRSGLLGLLAACLGIDRTDHQSQAALAASVTFAVRVDCHPVKMTDYHTVQNARRNYSGLKSSDTIQTWRDYVVDAKLSARYTVAITNTEQPAIALAEIEQAVKKPVFTPFLGRRSCPITRPMYENRVEAESSLKALTLIDPVGGTVYSEDADSTAPSLLLRDVPIPGRKRQFATRQVVILAGKGARHVS